MADLFSRRHVAAGHDHEHYPDAPRAADDPLVELARLIGQTDPLSDFAADQRAAPRRHAAPAPQYDDEPSYSAAPHFDAAPAEEPAAPSGPPRWLQRVAKRDAPATQPAADAGYDHQPYVQDHAAQQYADDQYDTAQGYEQGYDPVSQQAYAQQAYSQQEAPPLDPERYDEALYGRIDPALANDPRYAPNAAYQGDEYGYGDEYAEDYPQEEKPRRKYAAVLAVVALAVVGTGGAYAWRSLNGGLIARGEPPVIAADTAPIKVVPPTQASERAGKTYLDRLASGGGVEKLVPREETPVDVTSKVTQSAPRVVFPALNQNAPPATTTAVAGAGSAPVTAAPDTRKVRTIAVRPDAGSNSAAVPAPAAAPEPDTQTASIPVQSPQAVANGGFAVQVASQRSEADARASFRALQGRYPTVLAGQNAIIRRADLGSKGVHFRALVGPFGAQEDAIQLCSSLKSAGGDCFVQRN